MDKETGYITLDRVTPVAMGYPTDYGYIPNTLCEDGDPLDALLIIDESVPHGVVVPARPVGVLHMVDGGEGDEKLVCVAADDLTHDHIQDIGDLNPNIGQAIEHFYRHYKDWKNDWKGAEVSFKGWGGAAAAKQVVKDSIERYNAT
jgi:inorganic pyrophosphatase